MFELGQCEVLLVHREARSPLVQGGLTQAYEPINDYIAYVRALKHQADSRLSAIVRPVGECLLVQSLHCVCRH